MQSSGIIRKNEIFELDTRINQSIQKQIEPYIHNFYKNQALLTDLNLKYEAKITEAQRINENYQPLYNDVNNKICFIEKKLENLVKQSIIQPSKLQQDLTTIQNQISQINEVTQNNEQRNQNTQRQLINLEQLNENFKLDIQRLMELQCFSQTQLATEQKQQIFNLEQAERKLSLKLQNFDNFFSENNKKISQLQQKITEITSSIENKKDLEELNQKVTRQNQEIQILQKQMENFDKLTEQICLIETYLTQNLQYHIQDQINESLFICLPVRQFYKYTQYEKQRHDIISKQLVTLKKNKTLHHLMEEVEKILLNAAKRQQKVAETVKKMDDISDDENENIDLQVQKQKKVSKKNNQSSSENKMNQGENVQIKQNQSNLVYFEEQLKQVRDFFDQKFEDANNSVLEINRKINQLSNELYTSQIMFQAELDKNIQSNLVQSKKKFENIEKQVAELSQINHQSGIHSINEQLRNYKQSSKQILSFCKNILAIMQQDEIDKQGIRLIACRDLQIDDSISPKNRNNGMKRSSISIDRDCLSCSGQPIQLMKLFKIACLNYVSSDVFLDGTLYKREDLFEKCCQILCQEIKHTQQKNQKLQSIKTKRSTSIQESPKFFTTERGLKLQNIISHYKIFM